MENSFKKHLFKQHHKVKLKLDAVCQDAGDMTLEEFLEVYEGLKEETTITKRELDEKSLLSNLHTALSELLDVALPKHNDSHYSPVVKKRLEDIECATLDIQDAYKELRDYFLAKHNS